MVALQLLGSLGLLIFGMRLMSEALQKMAGPQLRHILAKMTTNRITGMLTTGISPTRTMASVSLPNTYPASSSGSIASTKGAAATWGARGLASLSSKMPSCSMAAISPSAHPTMVVWPFSSQ